MRTSGVWNAPSVLNGQSLGWFDYVRHTANSCLRDLASTQAFLPVRFMVSVFLMKLPVPIANPLRALLSQDGWILDDNGCAVKGGRRIQFFAGKPHPTKHLAVAIAPTIAEMNRLRASSFSHSLFTSVQELKGAVPTEPRSLTRSFRAEILANQPIGGPSSSYYLLRFRASERMEVLPPQFLMMNTAPVLRDNGPYLKRPFGVYRAHYRRDWLRNLALPPTLALALRPPLTDQFNVLYKVLPDGLGTNQMTQLKCGDPIHMLAPLGQPFDVRPLRDAGIEEVHVIGGGVGMAPLVMLVEMLRFYAFRVKVFLGIATLESLRYREKLLYIDDLLAAGVNPGDICVSCDSAPPKTVCGIPRENLYRGLVPDQYRRFLQHSHTGNKMAITCGPNRMMEVMTDICRQTGIPLKVLLEKRMGCGIGVCFSCVQKMRRSDGSEDYVRVCKEGPLFDAKDILWNPNDSKPPSVHCGCAARC